MTALANALAARRLADASVALSLIRATTSPAIIGILNQHLASGTRWLPAPLFLESVELDVEELRAHGFNLPKTAVQYASDWVGSGYLVRRSEGREEVYALSEGALAAIRFVEQLSVPRASVTESRLSTVIDNIHQLAVDTDPNVEHRIAALTDQRNLIDSRISALRAGEIEETPPDRALERAIDILSLVEELPEDFARVRGALERINRDLRKQLVEQPNSRGTILDDVFRGVDLLSESEAGRSFAAFYALLLDAERTMTFESEVDELVQRPFAIALTNAQKRALSKLLPNLQSSASEINHVMTSFSRSLRRFVQSEELLEDRKIHQLIRSAIGTATNLSAEISPIRPLNQHLYLTSIPINSISALSLLNPADSETTVSVASVSSEPVDITDLRNVVRESEIDFSELANNVNTVISENGPATIAEVLKYCPATQGIASVIGLLVLAEQYGNQTACDRVEHVTWAPMAAGKAAASNTQNQRGAMVPEYLFEEVIA